MWEQHRELHGELVTSLIRDAHTTPTSFRTGSNTLIPCKPLAQYKAHTGSVTVPRGHVERLDDGTEVKLGVWIMNQKGRRGKLTANQLQALADLGLEWAAA
ncbi:helicase associated domain-containing protein [Streptomyces sp. 2-1]|uniref:helicase associated domain-containing protein n=1 Tax=Streptomyces sp. 2-1 TaxID=412710 RepID=UPI003AFA214E